MPNQNIKKKSESIKPVNLSKDIWFYPLAKSFDFTVWHTADGRGQRVVTQFRILHRTLKKYMKNND